MAYAHVAVDYGLTAHAHAAGELLHEAKRVGIPAGEVEVTAHCPVVEAHFGDHEVVGDEHVCPTARAQDIALLAVEFRRHVAEKTPEIEPVCRRRFGGQPIGQLDFIEAAVGHRPEHRAPLRIERIDVAVGLGQPQVEGVAVLGAIGQGTVVAAVFVVGLPADDMRVVAIAVGQRAGDPARLLAIGLGGNGDVAARAVLFRQAVFAMPQHAGVGVG
ncbi:MAG: Uncharacterised protein [Rhodospirillaceae bacterium]|nr:MAG: Uncharacterised protein [Rhodospirillaceae bacterium]